MAGNLAGPAAPTAQYPVYTGVWTNWERGSIMGSTLTLPRRDADKLIAFTAFFVALVSSRFWRLASQAYHRSYSTEDPRDTLHHQRQAILRNSVSALSDSWKLILLSWTWRGNVSRGIRRMFPVMLSAVLCAAGFAAALCAAGFAAASVLSSWISTALNDEVLISGQHCGILLGINTDITSKSLVEPYWARQVSSAENYAQQCYSEESSQMLQCNVFVRDYLTSSINQRSPCPFSPQICRTNSSNLHLDSGYLNSGEHFGLNTQPNERILFRSVLHCAPLVTEGYTSTRNTTYANYTRYHYGSYVSDPSNLAPNNMTYEYPSRDSKYTYGESFGLYDVLRGYGNSFVLTDFGSITKYHKTNVNGSVFVPIPELFRSDGDVQVIFLSGNGIRFYEQTEDSWYRATALGYQMMDNTREGSRRMYWPEQAASPLGCVRQVQFCNTALPSGEQCGPLASWNDALFESAPLFNMTGPQVFEDDYIPTDSSNSRFSWIVMVLNNAASSLERILQTLGPESLASKENLIQGFMGRLAPNQWQLDVTHWWSTYLASIQAAFVETAIGPVDPTGELEQYKLVPWNNHTQRLCQNQKILSSNYTSFSMFGLCFTYALGILFIVASYVTEPLCSCLYRRYKFGAYAHVEWTTNGILHFQRMAYQGIESGSWTGQMDAIPTTKHGEILDDLPMRTKTVTPMPLNPPGKEGMSGQDGQTQEDLEIDSLIDGDDVADTVSISHHSSDTNEYVATPAAIS